jgi:hypothetical protein
LVESSAVIVRLLVVAPATGVVVVVRPKCVAAPTLTFAATALSVADHELHFAVTT